CSECVDGEELLFPVENISQQAGNNGEASGQGDYVLTSRSPTWKLTPRLVEQLTPDGWVSLPVLLSARRLEVRMAHNDREYSLHLEAEDASKIQIGEVLRVTAVHGGQLLFPVSDVQIPLQPAGASSATSASSLSSSQVSSPPDTLNASREKLRSEPWSPAAWHQASEMSCRGDSANSVWKHLDAQVISKQALWLFTPSSSSGASYSG